MYDERNQEQVSEVVSETLEQWEDYFEKNWLNGREPEEKTKYVLSMLGYSLIADDLENCNTLRREIKEQDLLVGDTDFNDVEDTASNVVFTGRKYKSSAKKQQSSWSKLSAIKKELPNGKFFDCVVDTDGCFEFKGEKLKVEHSDYGIRLGKEQDLWLYDKIWLLEATNGELFYFTPDWKRINEIYVQRRFD